MASTTENSPNWGWLKITMTGSSIRGTAQACRECMVFHYSGTATFMSHTTATANDIPLPITAATAIKMKVESVNELYFIGTNADVVMVIWRA